MDGETPDKEALTPAPRPFRWHTPFPSWLLDCRSAVRASRPLVRPRAGWEVPQASTTSFDDTQDQTYKDEEEQHG